MHLFPRGRTLALVCLALAALLPGLPARATILDDLASPVTTPAVIPLVVGTALTVALVATDDKTIDPIQKDLTTDRPLGSFSRLGERYGRGQLNVAYAAGMFVAGLAGSKRGFLRSWEMLEGSLFAVGLTQAFKETIHEERPNGSGDMQSFPSGHATGAFAFASVVGAEHGWGWGIPAYALATGIAVSRINDNKHYLHDVVAGATIGTAYGLGVYYSNNRKGKRAYSLLPLFLEDGLGMMATMKF